MSSEHGPCEENLRFRRPKPLCDFLDFRIASQVRSSKHFIVASRYFPVDDDTSRLKFMIKVQYRTVSGGLGDLLLFPSELYAVI